MKSVKHVTTVNFDRDTMAGITLAQIRDIHRTSGGRLVKGSGKERADVAFRDDGTIDATPKELTLLLTSDVTLPENPDDVAKLMQQSPATYLDYIVTGIKLDANQRMQALVKVENPATVEKRERDKKRIAALSRWATENGNANATEAFAKMQAATTSPAAMAEFDRFRDELVKTYGL